MISRVWHGWTTRDDADTDEQWLRNEVLPGIHRVRGFQGARLLRRDLSEEVEFVTITMFESLDAVKSSRAKTTKSPSCPPRRDGCCLVSTRARRTMKLSFIWIRSTI